MLQLATSPSHARVPFLISVGWTSLVYPAHGFHSLHFCLVSNNGMLYNFKLSHADTQKNSLTFSNINHELVHHASNTCIPLSYEN